MTTTQEGPRTMKGIIQYPVRIPDDLVYAYEHVVRECAKSFEFPGTPEAATYRRAQVDLMVYFLESLYSSDPTREDTNWEDHLWEQAMSYWTSYLDPPTWRTTFNVQKEVVSKYIQEMAQTSGYLFFLYESRVYHTATGASTKYTEADLDSDVDKRTN